MSRLGLLGFDVDHVNCKSPTLNTRLPLRHIASRSQCPQPARAHHTIDRPTDVCYYLQGNGGTLATSAAQRPPTKVALPRDENRGRPQADYDTCMAVETRLKE